MIDIGGGDSRLVDFVLGQGAGCLCVLDISGAALQRARERLGEAARRVNWIEADVTGDWHVPAVDVWHDRAVFHFLTAANDRARYVAHLRTALRPGGSAIIATFAPEGPERCSGLVCMRYSPNALQDELGEGFRLEEWVREHHETPFGTIQQFGYHRFIRTAE
jgi:SAM-dependent methyltransferase